MGLISSQSSIKSSITKWSSVNYFTANTAFYFNLSNIFSLIIAFLQWIKCKSSRVIAFILYLKK